MVLKDAVDWHNEGIDLHRSGNYEKAVQCYDRALEIDPKGADVWNNKGVALDALGRYDEAVQCYDRALEVDPKYASPSVIGDLRLKHSALEVGTKYASARKN